MANIDYFTAGQTTHSRLGEDVVVAQNTIDFSLKNAAAADTVELIKIPKGALVHNVYTIIITAEGSAATGDVGLTGGDTNGYNDALDLNATAGTLEGGINGTDAFVLNDLPKLFTADDTIDLVLDDAVSTCKLQVIAKYSMSEYHRNV